jgi:hypothetical protein
MNNQEIVFNNRNGGRPGDFYSTPKSLVWVASDIIKKEFPRANIFEPAAGQGHKPIVEVLRGYLGYDVQHWDLYDDGVDYLKSDWEAKQVITNPPFSLWDEFVMKAKSHCDKFMFIGRPQYFATNSRYTSGIWDNLKGVYPFNRCIDYRTPYRGDGQFHVGAMASAWFLWDMDYCGPSEIKVLDVQKYATLGGYSE